MAVRRGITYLLHISVILLVLILSPLFASASGSTRYEWIEEKGGKTYYYYIDLPSGITTDTKINGKGINFELLEKDGILVFGTPQDVPGNEFRSNEWRYLGFDMNGNKYSNTYFPNDADSGRNFYEKDIIKNPWENKSLNCPENVLKQDPLADATILAILEYFDTPRNGMGEQEFIEYYKERFYIQTLLSPGLQPSVRFYHKTADGRVWYQTLVAPAEKLEKKPQTIEINAEFSLGNSGYLGGPGTYYFNTLDGKNEGEEFTVTNTSRIDSEPWSSWASVKEAEGYSVEFRWSATPSGIIDISDLEEDGGTCEALKPGKTVLRLDMTLKLNGVVHKTDYEEREISVVTDDFMPIVVSPPTAKVNEKFKVELLKGSVLKYIDRINSIKWYIGEKRDKLLYRPEYDDKFEFTYSSSKVCRLHFQAVVRIPQGSEESNIAVTDLSLTASAKAKIDIPDYVYEGVYFGVDTDGSRVYYTEDGKQKSCSLEKAVEEGYADYEYEASCEYYEKPGDKLDGDGGVVYFDTLGKQWMKLWIDPSNGESVNDTDYTTVLPCPKAVLEVYGHFKENRRVTIDASKTLYHIKHPRVKIKTYVEITRMETGATYRITEDENIVNSDIKTRAFSSLKLDLHFVNSGDYVIKFHTEDGRGNMSEAVKTIAIRKDEPPLGDFSVSPKHYRNTSTRQADIAIESRALSQDGDIIGRQRIRYRHDSDNDGIFTDETWVYLTQGYDITKASLATGSVGKIEVELAVWEEPTGAFIPEFFTQDCKKSSTVSKTIEVDNVAPITSLMAVTEKEQDVLMLGDNLATLNAKAPDLNTQVSNDPDYLLKPDIKTSYCTTDTSPAVAFNAKENMGNYSISRISKPRDGYGGIVTNTYSNSDCLEIKDYFVARLIDSYGNYLGIFDKENMDLKMLLGPYNGSYPVVLVKDSNTVVFKESSSGRDKFVNMDTRNIFELPSGYDVEDLFIQDSKYLYCTNTTDIARIDLLTGSTAVIDISAEGCIGDNLRLLHAENGALFFFTERAVDVTSTVRYTERRFCKMHEDLSIVMTHAVRYEHLRYLSLFGKYKNNRVITVVDGNSINIYCNDYYHVNKSGDDDYRTARRFTRLDKNTGAVLKDIQLYVYDTWSSNFSTISRYELFEKYEDKLCLRVFNDLYSSISAYMYVFSANGDLIYQLPDPPSACEDNFPLCVTSNRIFIFPQYDNHWRFIDISGTYPGYNLTIQNTLNPAIVENTHGEVTYGSGNTHYIKGYDPLSDLYTFDAASTISKAFKYKGSYFLIPNPGSQSCFYVFTPGKGVQTIDIGFKPTFYMIDEKECRIGFFARTADGTGLRFKAYRHNGGFFDVIDKIENHAFRTGVNKYIGFYTTGTISYTKQQLDSLAAAIKAKGARVFFATTYANRTFAESLVAQTGGKYEHFDGWDSDIASFANYIKEQEGDKRENDRTLYVSKGETINYAKFFGDYESDPQHTASGERWLYLHTPGTDGLAGFHNQVMTSPVKSFDKNGTYQVYYNGRDNPKDDNRFDSYRKWSNSTPLTIIVGEGSAPVPLQLAIDISGDLRQHHRVDFKIQAVRGTYDIDWGSLKVSFDNSDHLPFSNPSNREFSRLFENTGNHTVTASLSDTQGNRVTVSKTFIIQENKAPIAGFSISGGDLRKDDGSAKFKILSAANPTDDSIGKMEYYLLSVIYADNGDGSFSPAGEEYLKVEPNEYGEIELDRVGENRIKQVVAEYYECGTGLAGEDLDSYRVFLESEAYDIANLANQPPSLSYSVNPEVVLKGSRINHVTSITDDTPTGDRGQYKFTHNPDYYRNSDGLNPLNNTVTDQPVEVFNYKGLYDFFAQAHDEDGAFTDWVYGGQVKVCSEPTAAFDLVSDPALNGGENLQLDNNTFKSGSIVTVKNLSYNEDYGHAVPNRGIEYIRVEYRSMSDMGYTLLYEEDSLASYPERFDLPPLGRGEYEVAMTVRSPEGFHDTAVQRFRMLEPRLEAYLEPETVPAGESYTVKAVVSKDALGVAVRLHDLSWLSLANSGEDNENLYFEAEAGTAITLPDATYPVEVYGIYPFGIELKKELTLNVRTPINLIPVMPLEAITGSDIEVGAETTKYAHSVKVKLFKGTPFETAYMDLLIAQTDQGKKYWSVPYTVPEDIPDGAYTAEFVASTPNGNMEAKEVRFNVSGLKILSVTIEGYWNHWRGQVDMFGKQMTTEPHRFLSLECVKVRVDTTGYADKIVIRFSPLLEAMQFTDKYGNVYDYKDNFDLEYVYFPQDSTFYLDDSKKENSVYWEYILPLAPSTKSWDDTRLREPYWMTVTAYKGDMSVSYTIDDIDITGNTYDLVYVQPLN